MLTEELNNKLTETLAICELHHQRMMFAWESVRNNFPLTEFSFGKLTSIELALFDQLIYRFSKLQDSLEEDVSAIPFIDILNKMEKLKLIDKAKDWIALRQTRNTVSHEYPFLKEVQADELNLLQEDVVKLSHIWLKLKEYTRTRFK
jgi:hypothetical protein